MNNAEFWNQTVFLALNARPGTAHWMLATAEAVANGLIYLIPIVLTVLWLWGGHRQRAVALKACIVAGLGLGAGQLIGLTWPHPRPFMIGLGHTWMPHAADASFPSDHLTVFAAVGLCMLLDGELVLGLALLAAGLCVAWARIFLGVHFPLDMLGAAGIAAIMYLLVTPVWHRMGGGATRLVELVYERAMAWPISRRWVRP
ncbi:undecaprenyl-diphosphatase [Rhodoferax ferrireducens]|uniref:undecaprenyl-diphosphatase n=1 Tax=Rhodoferax ferrireducens TaxID=192843 RepID=UPI001E60B5F5|nr:undecaprenyl-diphosphatase [Rhodoferax ferrireducens]